MAANAHTSTWRLEMKRFLMVALVGLAALSRWRCAGCGRAFYRRRIRVFIPGGDAALYACKGALTICSALLALRGSFDIGFRGRCTFLALTSLIISLANRIWPSMWGAVRTFGLMGRFVKLHATGGLEYFVDDDIALFAELQPGLFLPGLNRFGSALRFGANYHFD